MSAWNSSSLVASDSKMKSRGLLKRKSKQSIMEKKMFGSRSGKHGKPFQIGKKFKSEGKGTGDTTPKAAHGISPSDEEFDNMLEESVTHNPDKKKSKIKKKFFS